MEDFPVEMKVAVLSAMPNVTTLRNLTIAMPGYNSAYLGARKAILCQVLSSALSQEMLGEAYTLFVMNKIDQNKDILRLKMAPSLIKQFELGQFYGMKLFDQDEKSMVDITKTQLRMERVISKLSSYAILNRPNVQDDSNTLLIDKSSLSDTELTRFLRAFYRFDMICRMLNAKFMLGGGPLTRFPHGEVVKLLATFPYWESMEVNYVWQCLQHFYHDLLQRYSTVLGFRFGKSKYPTCERVITVSPSRQFLFAYEATWYGRGAEVCALQGLSFFDQIVSSKSEYEKLQLLGDFISNKHIRLSRSDVSWLEDGIDSRNPQPGARHVLRSDTKFVDDAGQPNAGILWAGDPEHDIIFASGERRTSKWLLSWGLVMWDFDRLEKWGILSSSQNSIKESQSKRTNKDNNIKGN